jgi:hypothetical protein
VITPETLDAVHTDEQAAEPRELGREPVKITTQDRSTPTCRPSEPLLEVPGTPGPTVGQ